MAIRNIFKEGEEILTKKCREVTVFDDRLSELIDDLIDTMEKAQGVGLAASQVGILRRVVVVKIEDDLFELVNPEIVFTSGEQEGPEGCLSFPGQFGIVKRPLEVKVVAQNRKGEKIEVEGNELLARALCHEIDHLNGITFKSKASRMLSSEELNQE